MSIALPPSTNSVVLSESHQTCHAWFPLSEAMLVVTSHLFVCQHSFQENAPWSCLAQRWDWIACSSLGLPLSLFKKWRLYFPFFSHQELHLTATIFQIWWIVAQQLSSSSLRTHRWISSDPIDLCTFWFLRWSRTWFSPTVVLGSLFSQSLHLPFMTWAGALAVEDWVIELIENLSLLNIPGLSR